MGCFLGIDIGTSSVKAVVMQGNGQILGVGSKEVSLITPKPGWVEQDPLEWWDASIIAIKQAIERSEEKDDISAIGVTGQMLGCVFLDKSMQVIDNCIIWMDQRAISERDYLENTIGIEKLLEITSNYPLTGYWGPKLLWLKKNRADIFNKTKKVLFPKDFVRLKLTGEISVDVSDSSGSYLFDVKKRNWSDEMFKMIGLPKEIVPNNVFESSEIAGLLIPEVAKEINVKPRIPVIAGGGDQTAGAIGNGIVREGVVSVTIGTSGVVFSCNNKAIVDKKPRAAISFCHSVPGKWCFFGCTLAAGGSHKWLKDKFIVDRIDEKSIYQKMDSMAEKAIPASEGLIFLPYLNGERTPHPDPNARGVFFGLSYRHGMNEIIRSVMEGVTFSLRDSIEIIKEYGIDVKEIRVSGGGARSKFWRKLQADIYNAEIITTNIDEGPSVGAAILAAVGSGHFSSVEEACDYIVKPVSKIEPNVKNVELYNDFYHTYRTLYKTLKNQFKSQSEKVNKWSGVNIMNN